MRIIRKSVIYITALSLVAFLFGTKPQKALAAEAGSNSWTNAVKQSMSLFEDKGGYYTGTRHPEGFTQNTWEGMDRAFVMGENDQYPDIDVAKARPSFCSSAAYMLLIKSISTWDASNSSRMVSRDAWVNLKPYTLNQYDADGNLIQSRQNDGIGCWGRANANGPGLAVLVKELDAGKNYYVGSVNEYSSRSEYDLAWDQAQPYDFMKIFWNDGIGCDDNNSDGDERGHMVLFLGRTESTDADGNRDDIIKYWSSNGSHTDINAGYGIGQCHQSDITRAVFTRITKPQNFNNAKNIGINDENKWLSDLNGKKHGTVQELKDACGIVEKTELVYTLNSLNDVEKEKYTKSSMDNLNNAIAAANSVNGNEDAAQQDVNQAVEALKKAKESLVQCADKEGLKELIDEADGLDLSKYNKDSTDELQNKLDSAKAVLANDDLSVNDQKTVDEAAQNLNDAVKALQPVKNSDSESVNQNDGKSNSVENSKEDSQFSGTPKTSDSNTIAIFGALAAFSMIALFILRYRKIKAER